MAQKEAKQVIVMRKDLNMRKGKMVAQGAHASIAFLCDYGKNIDDMVLRKQLSPAMEQWIKNAFKKICVGVDSEEELLETYEKAKAAGLESRLVRDSGLTEFAGEPTYTCVAIGPNWSEDIDKITGELKLL